MSHRRIVLDDSEIASEKFFTGLAGLDFTKRDGLWVPPNDIATGTVRSVNAYIQAEQVERCNNCMQPLNVMGRCNCPVPRHGTTYRTTNEDEEDDDLLVQVHLYRPDGRRLRVMGGPIRNTMNWIASPGEGIVLRCGRRLMGFHFLASFDYVVEAAR